jgi:glucose-1-phosphate thymidylyltransferase
VKAIIPAAGSGTRLRPQTHTLPKPLIHVAGKSILGYILDDLENVGIDKVGLILGEKGERIADYVNSNYDFSVDQVYQEERKGLGHAIYLYLSKNGFDDEPMIIVLSDTILEADLGFMLRSEYSCIAVQKVDDPRRFGVVELDGRFIKRLIEKPTVITSDLAIVGVYLIRNVPLLFDCLQRLINMDIKSKGEYQLTDALQLMLEYGEKMNIFCVSGWHDCGTPENLLKTNRHLLSNNHIDVQIPGSIIIPPVFIANSCNVENSIIGPHVSTADGSRVVRSIVQDSIVNKNASIHNALITGSIIGENANFNGQFSRLNIGDSSDITFSSSVVTETCIQDQMVE